MVGVSDENSAERGELSILACAESLIVFGISITLAIYAESWRHIAVGTCLAPLLLIRTTESTQLGLAANAKLKRGLRRLLRMTLPARDSIWRRKKALRAATALARAGYTLFYRGAAYAAIVLVIRFLVTIWGLFRHPIHSVSSMPANWYRVVLCTDFRSPLTILPGSETISDWTERQYDAYRRYGVPNVIRGPMSGYARGFLYFPAAMVRLSLKSTCALWVPLLWFVRGSFGNPYRLDIIGRFNLLIDGFGLASLALSLFTCGWLALKFVLLAAEVGFADWFNARRIARYLGPYIVPDRVPPWQLVSLINSAAGVVLFLWARQVLVVANRGGEINLQTQNRWLDAVAVIRLPLTIYVLFCSTYITLNIAADFPWPSLDRRWFPWQTVYPTTNPSQ